VISNFPISKKNKKEKNLVTYFLATAGAGALATFGAFSFFGIETPALAQYLCIAFGFGPNCLVTSARANPDLTAATHFAFTSSLYFGMFFTSLNPQIEGFFCNNIYKYKDIYKYCYCVFAE